MVIEAGDLAKTAALRKLFDGHKTAAAIACYADSVRDLADVVRDALRAEGLSIAPDALEDAVSRLGSDRGVTRREIEKLALYMHGQKNVTPEDVRAVMGDEAEARSESACDAAGSGDLARLDRELERLWASDTQPAQVIRSAMGHFQRLLQARESVERGNSLDDVMKRLRPPVHFSRATSLQEPGQRWNGDKLGEALDMLLEAEALTRTTGVPAEAVTGRALMNIAAMAKGRMMLKVRIIPCLDVKDGRVVKGMNFEGLRDAGDPVEQAIIYDKAGADELCFLDITASPRKPRHPAGCGAPHRRSLLHAADRGRRRAHAGRYSRPAAGRRRQGLDQHRRGDAAGIRQGSGREVRQPVHRRRHRRQEVRQRAVRDLHPWRAQGHRHRCGGTCQEAGRLWRGRNPAHLDGPRRRQIRLRPEADPRRGRCGGGSGDRLGRRRQRPGSGGWRHRGHASAVLAASIFHFGEVSIAQAKAALAAAEYTGPTI